MFKNDFNWNTLKEEQGDKYEKLYIPKTEEEYLSQMAINTIELGQYKESLSFPVKSNEIIRINDIQQDGLFRYKGINGLRDWGINDNPATSFVQNSPPHRIKGELKILDKQIEVMWGNSKNFSDKFKVLTFQSARLLSLQTFDDANKRAIKEVMSSSMSKLMDEYKIPRESYVSGKEPAWECISSLSIKDAVHSNNIAGMCNEMAALYDIDPSSLDISVHEIPPYQVQPKMDTLEMTRQDYKDITLPLCTEFSDLNIKKELNDAKLHDGLFENNPNAEMHWVRPSDLEDRLTPGQKNDLKQESRGFLKKILNKNENLPKDLQKLTNPMTRQDYVGLLLDANISQSFKSQSGFKAMSAEQGNFTRAKAATNSMSEYKSSKDFFNYTLSDGSKEKPHIPDNIKSLNKTVAAPDLSKKSVQKTKFSEVKIKQESKKTTVNQDLKKKR
jgi:hypothetical protein